MCAAVMVSFLLSYSGIQNWADIERRKTLVRGLIPLISCVTVPLLTGVPEQTFILMLRRY